MRNLNQVKYRMNSMLFRNACTGLHHFSFDMRHVRARLRVNHVWMSMNTNFLLMRKFSIALSDGSSLS